MTEKKYKVNGRPVTVTGLYDGHGPDDPSGIYYVFDDTPTVTHWMSQGAVPVRFELMENDDGSSA